MLSLHSAGLSFGDRTLWRGLHLDVAPGEFLAVLGPNGTGKTTLLKAILGEQKLTEGTVAIDGQPVRRGRPDVGYIPQQKLIDQGTSVRARDLVAFGLTGNTWGPPVTSVAVRRRVDAALAAVGATSYATSPMSSLSGGEQQRVRVAQAIIGRPSLLLCDEPLLSLDLANQRAVSELIDQQRREYNAAVIFVTHDVNPILGMVDRVLYLAGGQFRVGTPAEVLRSDVLTEMYGTPVDVFQSHGRIVVVGSPESHHHEEATHG